MIHNGICKAALFLAAGNIHRVYGSKTTDEVQGVLKRLPWSGSLLLVGFFAITGSPLFGPFVSEYQILSGAFTTGHTAAGVLFLILLLLVFFGMGNTIIGCCFGPAPNPTSGDAGDQGEGGTVSRSRFDDDFAMVAPILLCMALTVWLGLDTPEFLARWISEASAYLQRVPVN